MEIAAGLIREARKAAGLTMADLADRAGTSKPTISRYENGLVDPGVETLGRLLRACGQELRAIPIGAPQTAGLEDDRGVDVAQIRERLRLTPAERVDRLIEEVRVWNEIREFAGTPRP